MFNIDIINKLLANFSDWIKIKDDKCKWTIEDFPYDKGVDEEITYPHCFRCVTVNHCWFKNEDNKKPVEFKEQITPQKMALIGQKNDGLYHPSCHCEKVNINSPTIYDVDLIIPEGKIWWVFYDKMDWLIAMGYDANDKEIILNNIYSACKKAYVNGDYKLKSHDKYGFKVTLNIVLKGSGEKENKSYKLVSSFMIFPNGKLKNNTLIGGDQ